MKPKTEKSAPRSAAAVAPSALSAGKRRLFRWTSALLLPLLILGGLELALRLAGFGYPTPFFLRSASGLPGIFTENAKFGWRFFPSQLARSPDPLRLSKTKLPGTCRVFVFGESAALGDPEPAYGFSRILRELLEERCPAAKFEVVNVAMTAINSHVILDIARDCVPFQGDIWILYLGNNEVVGPFGAGSVFGSKALPRSLIRPALAAKRTRLGQMMDALGQRIAPGTNPSKRWEGMRMMLDEQIHSMDPVLERVYGHFRRNLEEVLSVAARAGVKPIVCSVSSNLKDCPPFASLHRPHLSAAETAEWTRWFKAGTELESKQEFAQALGQYRRAAAIDDTYAELPFRMARCHGALRELAAARQYYGQARDHDALRFRADTSINRIIRGVCASRGPEGAIFFDSDAVVTNACQLGIPGAECFWDHVHFNFAGNYLLAAGLIDLVISQLPEELRLSARSSHKRLSLTECAERLAFTDWDQRLVLERMIRRMHEPPFTAQLDHEDLITRWSGLLADSDKNTDRSGLARAVATYRNALERRSGDWILHHRLAFLLEAAGDLAAAQLHWERVIEIIPGYPDALFKLGDMNAHRSNFTQAENYYQQVLRLRPASFEAMNGLGLVLMSRNRFAEALQQFERAIQVEPKFAQAHVNSGLLLSRRGMTADAEAHLREALRCDPRSAGAHINLGNLLAAQQKHPAAIEHFQQAIKLQPNQATVHVGLGNSLMAAGRDSEALERYREAVRLDPALAEAQFNLGVALAKRGDLSAAASCFREAARLDPKDPQTLLSLGVALAQLNRLPEAIVQFQAVLRLDPANAAAKQYLDTATAREQAQR